MKFIALIFLLSYCSSTETKKTDSKSAELIHQKIYPAGEKEKIFDENGVEVLITSDDHPLFKKESKSSEELFRVLISSDAYTVRQIRQSDNIKRNPDLGGDKFMMEELLKFNKKDFIDDGIIKVNLNPKTGKIETVNTDRSTRIQQLLKIIQNDSTRWTFTHKTDEPSITKFNIVYNIVLVNKSSREQIKEELKKEVKK